MLRLEKITEKNVWDLPYLAVGSRESVLYQQEYSCQRV